MLACGPDAYLSHRAAAALHGFRGIRRMRPEVTSPHTDLPRATGITKHRTTGWMHSMYGWAAACEGASVLRREVEHAYRSRAQRVA